MTKEERDYENRLRNECYYAHKRGVEETTEKICDWVMDNIFYYIGQDKKGKIYFEHKRFEEDLKYIVNK